MHLTHLRLLKRNLRVFEKCTHGEGVVNDDMRELTDKTPHFWREEAKSLPEWWIRYGRSIGLYGSYDFATDTIKWQITRDAAHESTIIWPGKPDSEPAFDWDEWIKQRGANLDRGWPIR